VGVLLLLLTLGLRLRNALHKFTEQQTVNITTGEDEIATTKAYGFLLPRLNSGLFILRS
jgi:hypothetical protein